MIHNALKEKLHIKQGFAIMNSFGAKEICNEFNLASGSEIITRMSLCNFFSNMHSFDVGEQQHYKYDMHECLFTGVIGKSAGTFYHAISTINNNLSCVVGSRVQEDKAQHFVNLCFNSFNETNPVK